MSTNGLRNRCSSIDGGELVPSGAPLTPKQEAFCLAFVDCGSAVDAYESAYAAGGSSRATARVNAYRVLRNPKVAARLRELQDAAASRSLRSTAALIAELEEMVGIDPNELVRLDVGSCRHCWGEGGGYQWRDSAELAAAQAAYEAARETSKPVPAPDPSGGLGYQPAREPNPECGHCAGSGVPRAVFSSTADVSPGARRLLKGLELFPDGSVKRLLLHDQTALRIELHRLRGLHVERSVNVNVNADLPKVEHMTREQQLEFLNSLRPVSG